MARFRRPLALILLLSAVGIAPTPLGSQPLPSATGADTRQLERTWRDLDQQIRALDRLLPDPEATPTRADLAIPPLPENLLRLNGVDGPPGEGLQPLSLEQALAIAFRRSATLQAQRDLVAAALLELQSVLGTYWPRISAYAAGGTDQSATSYFSPTGTGNLFPASSPFFIPPGGRASLNANENAAAAGVQLRYELVDLARRPQVRAGQSRLSSARNVYANELRRLQLAVSESYYQLQRADQIVRIRDAAVRNDLLILQDTLELKQAGLVPRIDVLRRRAIEASDQELLIQALADRLIARRRLAVLLNLPPALTPVASDPIRLQPRWPLDLEASLVAAYRSNPELAAILATRDALIHQKDAVAAGLLPKLSLFASAGGSANNVNNWNVRSASGGCCGATVATSLNTYGSDWSVGLGMRWLLFDGGSTRLEAEALRRRGDAAEQQYVAQRNDIRLRIEQAFFGHEASLARLVAARRGVAASLEAFRDARLRYRSGLSSELDLSNTQERLIGSLVQRLEATVNVNITYAQLLRELLPMPMDPGAAVPPRLQLEPPPSAPTATDRSGDDAKLGTAAPPATP